MLITNRAYSDWAETIGMSPSAAKVALGSETRGWGVSRSRLTTVGTNVKWTILLIVTEVMTPKTFGEGGGWSVMDGDMDNLSWGREDSCSIGESLKKGPVESQNFFVNSAILELRFYCGGRGSASRGRRGRESR